MTSGRGSNTASASSNTARLLAVAFGGALGALSRYALGLCAAASPALITAGINVAGALALGVLTGLWAAGRGPGSRTPWVRAGLGPGFLGAFTTFSAIAVAALVPGSGLSWWGLALQVVVGVAAGVLGLVLGKGWAGRARPRTLAPAPLSGPGSAGTEGSATAPPTPLPEERA